MRIRLDLSYKGTRYFGWQKQPDHISVQQVLESALKKLFNEDFKTQGSGRTDAGTHALQQVVDFEIQKDISHFDVIRGLNRFLPEDIRVYEAYLVPDSFNSLKSAVSKTYIYKIQNSPVNSPLKTDLALWVPQELDLNYLKSITAPLLGEHDFSAFQTSGTELASTVRTIFSAEWSKKEDQEVWFTITGNGFLKQMVRNIVGTLLDGHWLKSHSSESIQKILDSKLRASAGSTAPAHGLYLSEVKYPLDLDKKSLKS